MGKTFISYPGLSEELVIDKEDMSCRQFFELVSSCGVFCWMPESMQLRFIKSLREANLPITGVIFITDEMNAPKIKKVFERTIETFEIVTFKHTSSINSYGLRVHDSVFTEGDRFEKLVEANPDHLVLVSTPYSCPDLWRHITNKDTIANRSSLFFFENKKVYAKWFRGEMNFTAEFERGNFSRLADFLRNAAENDLFFLKPLGDYTGGNAVVPLTREVFEANVPIIEALLKERSYYLFKKIDSLNVTSPAGEHQGTQFRFFIDNEGQDAGFMVKFSAETGTQTSQRTSLKRLSTLLNSSGGTAISIIFEDKDGTVRPVMFSRGKEASTDNPEEIHAFLQDCRLGDLTLSDPSDLRRIMEILHPKAHEIRDFFNTFFFKQSWATLYQSFFIAEDYFGERDADGEKV